MKHQVFFIHGGHASNTYKEYLTYLRKRKIRLEKRHATHWSDSLDKKLGKTFSVYLLSMPNARNAKYTEWKIWFQKYIPFMKPGVIFIGHSLGGIFLAKYLSEERLPKRIDGTFLVAAPFNAKDKNRLADFVLKKDLTRFSKQGGQIHLYHSKDDAVVPLSSFKNYERALPKAVSHLFKNCGHFDQKTFPEIVKDIKKLTS